MNPLSPLRSIQFFSDDQLARGAALSPTQVAQFLEDFRQLYASSQSITRCHRHPGERPNDSSDAELASKDDSLSVAKTSAK